MVYPQQTNTALEGVGILMHPHLQVVGSLLLLQHGSPLVHSQLGSHHLHQSQLGHLLPRQLGNHLLPRQLGSHHPLQRHLGKQTQSPPSKRPGNQNHQVVTIKLDRYQVEALTLVVDKTLSLPRINRSPALK